MGGNDAALKKANPFAAFGQAIGKAAGYAVQNTGKFLSPIGEGTGKLFAPVGEALAPREGAFPASPGAPTSAEDPVGPTPDADMGDWTDRYTPTTVTALSSSAT